MIFSNKKIYLRSGNKPKNFRPGKRMWFYGAIFLIGLTAGWWGIPYLMSGFLVYEAPVSSADAVLVESLGQPLAKAIEFYKDKKAGRFFITVGVPDQYRTTEKPPCLSRLIKDELVAAGVPEKDIDAVEKESKSLLEEQLALRAWVRKNNIRSYLSMQELYSTRFAKMVHDQTFPKGDVRIDIYPLSGRTLLRKQWLQIQNVGNPLCVLELDLLSAIAAKRWLCFGWWHRRGSHQLRCFSKSASHHQYESILRPDLGLILESFVKRLNDQ